MADALDEKEIRARYRKRTHVERVDGRLLSFFTPGRTHSRHVVLRDKERIVARRHGALPRGGQEMLPDEAILCATAWMHGVFGAQLTIGNTSFHKLFSVSRDPYNITRGSGLRMLAETEDGWRLLTVPSAFEMGLDDCRWIYRLSERAITVSAAVSGDEPAMQWRVAVEGNPCRFLVFGHLVLGEQEFAHAGRMEIDARRKQFAFRPDPDHIWGQKYPHAVYHLVTSTPRQVEAVGGDELLYADGKRRSGAYATIRTRRTSEFAFAVVGSMTDPKRAKALAAKYMKPVVDESMLTPSDRFWRKVTRGVRVRSAVHSADAEALDTIFPWLAHDAIVHLTAPHGLEQYTGGAWGVRDVCQGPLEYFLSLEHDEPAKAILRILFAQQYEKSCDWPQWFMLEPYSAIQSKEAHGDIIVWPLKALCDYVEATGDFAFLDERIAWRRDDNFEKTAQGDPIATHVDRLIATVRERFIAGTSLIRYGNGDWNDSLQPVDPAKHDWMTSSWTVELLYEQLRRYAEILRRAGRPLKAAKEHDSLAATMREDFNRFLIRDDIVAGYGVFSPNGGLPELLLHPSDKQTGLSFSLLPMTQGIIGGIFTKQQARRHLGLIRKHLLFSDGARLMDRPSAYHGGARDDIPAGGISLILRARDRAHVYAFASALCGSHERPWRIGGAVDRSHARQSHRRHRSAGACVAQAAQRLFQQQRCGLPGSLSSERGVGAGQSGQNRGRRRMANIFQRLWPHREHAHPPRVRGAPAFRRADPETLPAGLPGGSEARMARQARRRPTRAVTQAA